MSIRVLRSHLVLLVGRILLYVNTDYPKLRVK